MAERIDVLHVGSACRDVDPGDPRGWRLGGGVNYAALSTSRLGLRTAAVVGVDADARDAREFDALREAGVDLLFVPLREGPIYHNQETPTGRVQTCIQPGAPLPIPALPESWLNAAAWSIVPVAGEVGDRWAATLPHEAVIAVAWQGLLRHLVAGERVTPRAPRPSRLLRRADLVGVSHHDLDRRTRVSELVRFLHPGARLLVTRGAHGGLLVEAGRNGPGATLGYLPAPTEDEVDPTGAGDTFLAALLATAIRPGLARRGRVRQGLNLAFAAAAGSLVVEGPGLAAVPDLEAVNLRSWRMPGRGAVRPVEDEHVGEDHVGEDPAARPAADRSTRAP